MSKILHPSISNHCESCKLEKLKKAYFFLFFSFLVHRYGCPTMDELEEFSRGFKKRLDDAGAAKVVPEDLALEVKKSLSS